MRPTVFVRTTLAAATVLCGLGAMGAARAEEWDLVIVFGAVAAMTALLLARTWISRILVPIRADLVRWMAGRAAVTGERTEDLADRAIAAYRDGLTGEVRENHDQADE